MRSISRDGSTDTMNIGQNSRLSLTKILILSSNSPIEKVKIFDKASIAIKSTKYANLTNFIHSFLKSDLFSKLSPSGNPKASYAPSFEPKIVYSCFCYFSFAPNSALWDTRNCAFLSFSSESSKPFLTISLQILE